ncbi:hypothetical protein DRO66_04940 [Candidatus Bathyarchaeota archaeon]|nr:MAG: hypothetical protein DRO66_04940 [Candidatus Bathyarchaeota archaeon]
MEILEIYLDNTQIFDWVNWDDYTQEISREDSIKTFAVQVTSTFRFTGDGYKFILDKLNELGPCATISAKVVYRPSESSSEMILEGTIFTNSLNYKLENSGVECIVECKIEDNAFGRFIIGNQDAEFFIGQGISLTGVPYTGATPIDLTMFDPEDDTDISGNRRVYDVKDAILDIVEALSGDDIVFSSSWYDALPDDERYCVTIGSNIRLLTQSDPYISFRAIVSELQKKYNLWLFSARIDGVNTIKLEQEDFITQFEEIVLNDVRDIDVSFDESKFYSTVNVGSTEFIRDDEGKQFNPSDTTETFPFMSNFPYVPLVTHIEELFNVESECSAGSSLDLISQWVIDHNVILKVVKEANDEYDDDTFLIQYDRTTNRATPEILLEGVNPFGIGKTYQYNGQIINERVVDRWRFQGDITNNFVDTTDKFRIGTSNSSPLQPDDFEWNPTPMDLDSPLPLFNDNNRWDTTNYEFLVQETGVYRFDGEILYEIVSNASALNGILASWIYEYSPTGIFINKTLMGVGGVSGTGNSSIDFFDQPAYLHKNNIAVWVNRIDWPSPAVGLSWRFVNSFGGDDTVLELKNTVTTGDFTEEQSANTLFSQRMQFQHAIDSQTWLDMVQNPARGISIVNDVYNGRAEIAKGWPKKISINFVTGMAQWDLITNIDQEAFSP